MKIVKVKDLKPGDVLATSKLVVFKNRGQSLIFPEEYIITVMYKNGTTSNRSWKPETTVSILDK